MAGDAVFFHAGKDAKGRLQATHLRLLRQSSRVTASAWLLFGGLLILPIWAGFRLPYAPWGAPAVMLVFSLLAWAAYAGDKAKARAGSWRTAESTLHLLELCGGWPGAFLAQRHYRHKTAKISFQLIFWMIVFIHQYAAIDVLENHEPSGRVMQAIQHIKTDLKSSE